MKVMTLTRVDYLLVLLLILLLILLLLLLQQQLLLFGVRRHELRPDLTLRQLLDGMLHDLGAHDEQPLVVRLLLRVPRRHLLQQRDLRLALRPEMLVLWRAVDVLRHCSL